MTDTSNTTEIYLPSLLLQVFLCSHQWFLHCFVLVLASLFAYKHSVLETLSTGNLMGNVVLLAVYMVLENTRLRQSSKGNKTRKRTPLVLAIILAVLAVVCNACLLRQQTHVLHLESIANGLAIVLLCVEVVLATLTLLWLFRKSTVA